MCGICGAMWTKPAKSVSIETLNTMTDILRHRGPDDRGTFYQNWDENHPAGVALGHRRLSILDLSPQGRQPMGNEDDTVQAVFNGEIYNYEPLRQELLQKGHRFKSNTDTEVIVHLYEEDGVDFVKKLNGMFAIAVWDGRKNCLSLYRDRIGKKPLYYCIKPDRIIFASELKSILALPDAAAEIDTASVDDYLTYQYVPHPATIFKGIFKLEPAHYLVCTAGQPFVPPKPYWQIESEPETAQPFADACEQLRALVFDAVKIRLRSDVPVGAFLSGGIDSSITAGVMQKILGEKKVRTFSIGFGEKEYD
ncbi:MAG: asparagine synthase (glutamine-hydrolyzing), partial [Planctomycetaceae bacterium]|nr:asparagine synthase (glutamine-hydrolyzing) [Planctomycetaceae bacterium]